MKPSLTYFRLCQGVFVAACCVGGNFGLSYLSLTHTNDWAAWRPGIGLLSLSMVLSFVGYGRCVQRSGVLHPGA